MRIQTNLAITYKRNNNENYERKDEKVNKKNEQIKQKNYDFVELSTKEQEKIEENLDNIQQIKDMIKDMIEGQKKENPFKEMLKNATTPQKGELPPEKIKEICSKIAGRIRKGHKVPLKDIKFLMKNDPGLYQFAMSSKQPNKNPKKCKQLSPNEEGKKIEPSGLTTAQTGSSSPSLDVGQSGTVADSGASTLVAE